MPSTIVKPGLLCALFAIALAAMPAWAAPKAKPTPTIAPATIAQVKAAKKVFLSNMGDGPTYDEFYASMKAWGRYEIASAPGDADLDFEINYAEPCETETVSVPSHIPGSHVKGADSTTDEDQTVCYPQVVVNIVDPASRTVLENFTEYFNGAHLSSNFRKNMYEAVKKLVYRLQAQIGDPPAAIVFAEPAPVVPMPPQIAAAKKVFVEATRGSSIPAYEKIYATLLKWTRFTFVPAASDADLIFEIQMTSDAQMQILDSKTRTVLWVLTGDPLSQLYLTFPVEFTAADQGFAATYPDAGIPAVSSTPAAGATPAAYSYEMDVNAFIYLITVQDFAPGSGPKIPDMPFYTKLIGDFAKSNSSALRPHTKITAATIAGHAGVSAILDDELFFINSTWLEVVPVNDRVYLISFTGPKGNDSAAVAEKFFATFRLLTN